MSERIPDGAVLLNQPAATFRSLDAKVQQRVGMDITANTLISEAANMLDRARNLLAHDVGHWEDMEGNVELATRVSLALGVLTGQVAREAAGE